MKNSMFVCAPHSTQPIFEAMFGQIPEKYLTRDIKKENTAYRKVFSNSLQLPKVLKLDPKLANQAIILVNERLGLTGKKFKPSCINSAAARLPTSTSSVAPDYVKPKVLELPRVVDWVKQVFSGEISLPKVKLFWPITLF
jgi:hypothetical protein